VTADVNESDSTGADVGAATARARLVGAATGNEVGGRDDLGGGMAERAYAGLRDLIVTLRIPPGAPLHEDSLTARFGVGRTPLREAVKRLATENLVVVHPRRGTFVTEVNLVDHTLISDVRLQLEGHAAERAATWATDADRVRLTGVLERIRHHPGGREEGMRLDTDIHREVYRCAHNRYLEADLDRYYNLSLRIWYLLLDRLPEVDHRAEHLPMVEAIVAGDAGLARAHAVDHVVHFDRAVRAAL
jgi:DNA-binding GntR family transcriptional regulator